MFRMFAPGGLGVQESVEESQENARSDRDLMGLGVRGLGYAVRNIPNEEVPLALIPFLAVCAMS